MAVSLDLAPPSGLEQAYEDADTLSALGAAAQLATTTETSLESVAAATGAAAEPRDWLVTLGLVGKDPDALLSDARADWQQGNLAAAADAAGLVVGTLAVAGDAGRGRAILIACAVALVLLLVALLALILRHRRRRRARALAAAVVAPIGPQPGASIGLRMPPASAPREPPEPPAPPGAGTPAR